MQQFIEFVARHWMLSLAFVGLLGLLVGGEIRRRRYGIPQIGPLAATQAINHEDALVLDTREDSEYARGHLPHALHVPLGKLPERLPELEKYRDRPVIVYCRSGNRSMSAAQQLAKAGFGKVCNLQGGIMAWQSANLPVTRK